MRAGDIIEGEATDIAYGGDAVVRTVEVLPVCRGNSPRHNEAQTEVEDAGGKAGRRQEADKGIVVFVPGIAVGEKVRIRITRAAARHCRGKLLAVLSPSGDRIAPPCPHFADCGGCHLQHLNYETQARVKRKNLVDALERIGKLSSLPEIEILAGPESLGYRHRASLHGSGDGKTFSLGYLRRGSHTMVEVRDCLLLAPVLRRALKRLRKLLAGLRPRTDLPFGNVILRLGVPEPDLLLELHRFTGTADLAAIAAELETIEGVRQAGTARIDTSPSGMHIRSYGPAWISLDVRGIPYRVGPGVFFQNNLAGAEALVAFALQWAEGGRRLLDVHCGVGLFTLPLARYIEEAWGCDPNARAIAFARANAKEANAANARFVVAPGASMFAEEETSAVFDRVILDPPRGGCDRRLLSALAGHKPEKILYISCDPPALARDAVILHKAGYECRNLAFLDNFPQTYHIEAILSFEYR